MMKTIWTVLKIRRVFKVDARKLTKLSFILPTVLAKAETTDEKLGILNFKECLKHACLLNVNAASSLLTTTIYSIEILVTEYKETMTTLTGLLDECVLMNGWNEEIWDSVIAYRSESTDQKLQLDKLILYLDTVRKVVEAAIEATFFIDANYLCATLCERSHSAEEKIKKLEMEVKDLEDQYLLALASVAKFQEPAGGD